MTIFSASVLRRNDLNTTVWFATSNLFILYRFFGRNQPKPSLANAFPSLVSTPCTALRSLAGVAHTLHGRPDENKWPSLRYPTLLAIFSTGILLSTNSAIAFCIRELVKSRTVVMIAHRLKTVQNAVQILVVQGGSIWESGTHAKLVKKAYIIAFGRCKTKRWIGIFSWNYTLCSPQECSPQLCPPSWCSP